MTALESVDQGLAVLGRALGFPLELGPERACALRLDDGLECSLEVPDGSSLLHLHCPLLPVPPVERLAFLERVLALNLYGAGDRRCRPGARSGHRPDRALLEPAARRHATGGFWRP